MMLEEQKNNHRSKALKKTKASNKSVSKTSKIQESRRSKKCTPAVDDDDDIGSWFCKLCNECVQENMIKCQQCNEWMHSECAGVSDGSEHFICDFCN